MTKNLNEKLCLLDVATFQKFLEQQVKILNLDLVMFLIMEAVKTTETLRILNIK